MPCLACPAKRENVGG